MSNSPTSGNPISNLDENIKLLKSTTVMNQTYIDNLIRKLEQLFEDVRTQMINKEDIIKVKQANLKNLSEQIKKSKTLGEEHMRKLNEKIQSLTQEMETFKTNQNPSPVTSQSSENQSKPSGYSSMFKIKPNIFLPPKVRKFFQNSKNGMKRRYKSLMTKSSNTQTKLEKVARQEMTKRTSINRQYELNTELNEIKIDYIMNELTTYSSEFYKSLIKFLSLNDNTKQFVVKLQQQDKSDNVRKALQIIAEFNIQNIISMAIKLANINDLKNLLVSKNVPVNNVNTLIKTKIPLSTNNTQKVKDLNINNLFKTLNVYYLHYNEVKAGSGQITYYTKGYYKYFTEKLTSMKSNIQKYIPNLPSVLKFARISPHVTVNSRARTNLTQLLSSVPDANADIRQIIPKNPETPETPETPKESNNERRLKATIKNKILSSGAAVATQETSAVQASNAAPAPSNAPPTQGAAPLTPAKQIKVQEAPPTTPVPGASNAPAPPVPGASNAPAPPTQGAPPTTPAGKSENAFKKTAIAALAAQRPDQIIFPIPPG